MTTPQPGQTWQEKKPPNAPAIYLTNHRRIIRIHTADPYGYVTGTGCWQHLTPDGWVDGSQPGNHRKTRIRYHHFTRRYQHLPNPTTH